MAWIRRHDGPRGRRYRVHYRDPAGHERSQTFRRAAEAERFARSIEVDKERRTYHDPEAGRELFGSYLHRWLSSALDLQPATRALYDVQARRQVLPWFGDHPLAAISPPGVREWLSDMVTRGVGVPTVQVAHRLLSRVLAQAVTDGSILTNPAARARPPRSTRKPPRILEPVETERLAAAIDPRFRAMILLAGYGGLRFGECAALRRRAVRVLQRSVEVSEAATEVRGHVLFGQTKTGGRRSVTIPASLAEEMGRHMAAYLRPATADKAGNDLVFTDSRGGPLRRTNWRRRVWSPAVEAAGIEPPPGFHDLRHSAAAAAIAAGGHAKAIQARLGHGSIRTTLDLYGSLLPGLDVELAERLDAVRVRSAERLRNDSPRPVARVRGSSA